VSILRADAGYAQVRRLPVGGRGQDLEVDGATGTLYVLLPDSGRTFVAAFGFDGGERARAQLSAFAADIALEPSRGLLAATSGDGVEFLDLATLASRARVTTGSARPGARRVAMDGSSGLAAVSHAFADEVALVSLESFTLLGRVPVDAFPAGLAFADGALYVAANDADRLDVVDVSARAVRGALETGNGPDAVAASPALERVFVADDLGGQVTVVDVSGGEPAVAARWPRGHGIPDVAVDAAGERLFVLDPSARTVEVLDASTGALLATGRVGDAPVAVRGVVLE
jgi:DNA-binding beta-propeller fold protein YncE